MTTLRRVLERVAAGGEVEVDVELVAGVGLALDIVLASGGAEELRRDDVGDGVDASNDGGGT